MAHLAPSLEETRGSVVIHLVSLEKQVRVGKVRGFFQIPKFPEDPELCPVQTLTTYFNKVRSVNFDFLKLYTFVLADVRNPWRCQVIFCVLCESS